MRLGSDKQLNSKRTRHSFNHNQTLTRRCRNRILTCFYPRLSNPLELSKSKPEVVHFNVANELQIMHSLLIILTISQNKLPSFTATLIHLLDIYHIYQSIPWWLH